MKKPLLNHVLYMTRLFTLAFITQCLTMSLLLAWNGSAQVKSIEEVKVYLSLDEVKIEKAFKELEKHTSYNFVFATREIRDLPLVTFEGDGRSLYDILADIAIQAQLNFKQVDLNIHVKKSDIQPTVTIVETIDVTVTGIVTDQNGEPLPGVTVSVPGTTIGTATDMDGKYALNVPEGSTLVFSFIGFESQSISIGDRSVVDVVLGEDISALDEVVVVGYGTQKRMNLTGAVVSVDERQLTSSVDANLASRLQGRVAGITVSRDNSPGGEVSVRIRGYGSINNNDPLYVIDGVPITGGLAKINPNDIESMTILKDAAASSIYGSRSANGVVIITTKRGEKGRPRMELTSRYGMQQASNQLNLLNTREYGELYWLQYQNTGLKVGDVGWGNQQYGYGPEPVIPDYIFPAGKMLGEVDEGDYSYPDPYYGITKANKTGTNWYDEIFVAAPIQEHNLSLRGGSENTTYAFSLGYMDQKGILDYTGFKRFSIRANGDLNITDWLKIGQSIGAVSINRVGASYNSEGGPIAQAYRAQPIIPVYDIIGNFAGTKSPTTGNASNPVAELYRNKDNSNNETRILANVYGEIDFNDNLRFRSLLGIDHNRNRSTNYSLRNVEMSEARVVDVLTEGYSGGLQYNWSNTLNYNKVINDVHDINVLVGTEAVEYEWDWLSGGRSTFAFTDIDYMVLNAGEAGQTSSGSIDKWATFSYFGRINYAFKGKYLVEGVFRGDASSRFSAENRWGRFPALSAGWLISQEQFLQNVNWLDELKIRGGWGINGNDNVGNYNIYSTFRAAGQASYYNISGTSNSSSEAGFHKYKLGNPDAKWESTISRNLGLDASVLNGRMQINIDVYSKITRDMLYPDSRPSTWGTMVLPSINVGEMKNSGLDLMLAYNNSIGNDFNFNVQANLSHYKNTVISLNENSNEILYGNTIRNEFFTATKGGEPVSSFYGYVVEGIFNTQEEVESWPKYNPDVNGNDTYSMPGVFKYRDVNKDGKITSEDRTFIGDPHPDFSYGFNLMLQYKNWDLTVFFQGVSGNEVMNYAKRVTDFNHFSNNRSYERLYESWTQERYESGAKITLPMALSDERDVVMQNASSFFIEDGSYFRMKDLQIGYTLPKPFVSRYNVENLHVYFQAVNLFTLTKYSGLDPEFRQSSDRQIGVDVGIYPTAQTFILGIALDL